MQRYRKGVKGCKCGRLEKLLHCRKSLVGALRGDFSREEVEHQTKPAPNTPYATSPRFPNQNKKNSVKFWLIPILDRIFSCNSQEP